jgi:hypothetical protein
MTAQQSRHKGQPETGGHGSDGSGGTAIRVGLIRLGLGVGGLTLSQVPSP